MTHAGFAASIALREELLQDFLRILHGANKLPHRLSGSLGGVNATLFLDVPRIRCSRSNTVNVALYITAWGTVTSTSFPFHKDDVVFSARILVRPKLSLTQSPRTTNQLTVGVDPTTAVVDEIKVSAMNGQELSPSIRAYIATPAFKTQVAGLVNKHLVDAGAFSPPLSLAFLGPLGTAPGSVTARVVDGALAIGFDTDIDGTATRGDGAALMNTVGGQDLGVWINPAALSLFTAPARARIENVVSANGAVLDSLVFDLLDGKLHISGKASRPGQGSVTFSLDLTTRTALRYNKAGVQVEEWSMEQQNVVVEVQRAWWVYVIEALLVSNSLGISIFVIESIVGMIRNDIYFAVKASGGQQLAVRNQKFTFADTEEPEIHLAIERWELHQVGIFTGVSLRPRFRTGSLSGPSAVSVEDASRGSQWFHVTLPFGVHPADPRVYVRWTARRNDTNDVIAASDGPAGDNMSFQLTAPVLMLAPSLTIECRVYRALETTTELFGARTLLAIQDQHFDRTHPYVRWEHPVRTPEVRVERDGSRTYVGTLDRHRVSAIHRTDYPARCQMVTRYSDAVLPEDDGSGRPHLQYLDQLPFPRAYLNDNRSQVCDYCFFGGPTKTVPLP